MEIKWNKTVIYSLIGIKFYLFYANDRIFPIFIITKMYIYNEYPVESCVIKIKWRQKSLLKHLNHGTFYLFSETTF